MIICNLCKKNEAKQKLGTLDICNACSIELQLSFSYHIAGSEVTKEEYEKKINEKK